MTIKALYPTVRPTLNLDFAKTKVLDPRITFTRASTATFVGSNGLIQTAASGAARFDHNPATGESLGLLVEEARTNSFLYSQEIDTGNWRKFNITATANAGLAPDGTTTAELITTASTTATRYFDSNPQPVLQTSSDYCVSFYVKLISGTGNAAKVSISSANGALLPAYVSYELRLDNFAESTGGNLPSVRGYTIFPNGWVRMYMVFNTSTQTNANLEFRFGENNTVSSFHVWGLQIEKGAFPTSYIPTTSATVTRAADVADMTGTNFSSWYNQSEGTLLANYIKTTTNTGGVFKTSNGTFDQRIDIMYRSNSANVSEAIVGGTSSARYDYTVNLSTKAKQIFAYKLNNFNAAYNGTVFTADTSGSVPTVTQALIGSNDGPSEWLNAPIARLAYYPVRLPDAQLQALTAT